ncbi:MAG: TonB-dependent receptor [Bacteroidales bacterium]|nr:TonB-dependent receptor [Bacteroidales bacterium]
MKRETIQFRKVLLLLAMLLVSFDLLAQISVTGQVTDESGEGLPGVTVLEKGTTNGTITDLDGKFRLGVNSNNAVVVFSFVGYDTQEMSTASTKNLKVVLKETAQQIEEVVIVGYGQQKKASVVGAITQASAKTIERAAGISDLGTALTGNLPGVTAVAGTGQPGEEAADIRIRGFNSFNSEAKALVLVDGIERDMKSVDPASVQNVAVLKDASATAVFGVKGANGVILITTKRGQEGRAQINASYSTTLKTVSKLPGKYDSYDAFLYRNIAIEHELNVAPDNFNYIRTQQFIQNFRPSDPNAKDEFGNLISERFPNVDWQDILFKKAAVSHNASVNISGGNKFVRYFSAIDWANEGDLFDIPPSGRGYQSQYDYNRFNVRSNLDFSLTKSTVFKVNLSGSIASQHAPQAGGDGGVWQQQQKWSGAYNMAPDMYMPLYSNGLWGNDGSHMYSNATNSLQGLATAGYLGNTTSKITTDFILEQKLDMLLKGLSFRGSVSWDNQFKEAGRGLTDNYGETVLYWIDPMTGKEFPSKEYNTTTGLEPTSNAVIWSTSGGYQDNGALNRALNYRMQLDYRNSFGKNNVSAMGMFQRSENTYSSQYPYYREDWVFRLTYDWNERFFAEYNGSYNGSEKFSDDYRFAFFNSGAIGWNIHKEAFMSSLVENRIIDNLKLRGSIGQVGDDNVGGRWLYTTEWATGGGVPMDNLEAASPYSSYRETKIGNPDIHWETVTKYNLGLDYSFLDGFVAGTFELFQDKRKDCVVGSRNSVPAYFGANAVPANLGKVESHGYEIEVRLNKNFGKFHTWANLNYSHSENKIIERADPALLPDYRKDAGYMFGQVRTYVDNGSIRTWDDLITTPATYQYQEQRLMGDYTFIDFNCDGEITQDDQIPYGYAANAPQNSYNATLGVDWKGWSFFAQFYGVSNIMRDISMTSFAGKFNTVFDQGVWFSKNVDDFEVVTPRYTSNMFSTGTQFWSDASYLRLKTLELSYTFNKLNVGKFTFSNVKLYFNGNNLYMWTKLPDDRESNGNWSSGGGAYPSAKRFTFGIRFSL